MAKICPLFSSSSGNSTYIGTPSGGILIDAGASFKGINEALIRVGGSVEEIKAVAVTHAHDDHIKGLKTFLKRTNAILIASAQTAETLISNDKIPEGTRLEIIEDALDFMDTEIKSFSTSHDCAGSCGYSFTLSNGKKISICTDLGIVTDSVRTAISGSDAILIESNHDIEMLKKGPYTPALKLRILSDAGHISNVACAAEIKNLLKSGTTRFILGHLSQHNNTPLLALSCSESALIDMGAVNGRDCILSVASPKNNGVTVI